MDLDKNRNYIEGRTDSGAYSFRVKSALYIGDCIRELTCELKNINKNLEKIAKENGVLRNGFSQLINDKEPLRPLKGEFYGPPKKELDLNHIILGPGEDNYGRDKKYTRLDHQEYINNSKISFPEIES